MDTMSSNTAITERCFKKRFAGKQSIHNHITLYLPTGMKGNQKQKQKHQKTIIYLANADCNGARRRLLMGELKAENAEGRSLAGDRKPVSDVEDPL